MNQILQVELRPYCMPGRDEKQRYSWIKVLHFTDYPERLIDIIAYSQSRTSGKT